MNLTKAQAAVLRFARESRTVTADDAGKAIEESRSSDTPLRYPSGVGRMICNGLVGRGFMTRYRNGTTNVYAITQSGVAVLEDFVQHEAGVSGGRDDAASGVRGAAV